MLQESVLRGYAQNGTHVIGRTLRALHVWLRRQLVKPGPKVDTFAPLGSRW